ncbi:MAG: hypothetical protein LBB40_03535 [Holophagales bacterium]|nr:hypothetical protein [Holophagales bacterium]
MSETKNFFANAAAVIYFITAMLSTILLLIYIPIVMLMDIGRIRESGFATANVSLGFIGLLGTLIGISLLVPAFRRMYYKLPWLFPLVKILYINVVITSVAKLVMNFGYEIQDEARHTKFFALTIAVIVIGRILMCLWFNRKKVEYIGGVNVRSQ